jgi:hypothetical protein
MCCGMRLGIRLAVSVVLASLAIGALAAAAEAAPTLTPGRAVPMASPALYTLAPDGTFWVVRSAAVSQGTVSHLGAAGEVLSESSINQSSFDPLDIGYFDGQVYIASPSIFENQLYAWPVGSIGKTPPTFADLETERHWGSVQFSFRINSAGIISAAFGQNDKIGLFNGATAFGEHPYYPWTVMGAGINNHYVPNATPFESCESLSGPVIGEPKVCGISTGSRPGATGVPTGSAIPMTSPRFRKASTSANTPVTNTAPASPSCASGWAVRKWSSGSARPARAPAASTDRCRSSASRPAATST